MTGQAPERALAPDDGELSRAMGARNWAETPIGSPETWPAELRNAVRILLTSRFSMWAAWGPDLTMFYNDAYRRDTLQAKHPWALGRPAREVWAEIWHDIGPRIQSVLDTGVATWDEDLLLFLERSGYPEETYHTFSYSPLDGEDGRTEGMLCVVTENTQRVVGERRMANLRDLAAAIAGTRTESDVLGAVAEQLGRNLRRPAVQRHVPLRRRGRRPVGVRRRDHAGLARGAGGPHRRRPGPGVAVGPRCAPASRCWSRTSTAGSRTCRPGRGSSRRPRRWPCRSPPPRRIAGR